MHASDSTRSRMVELGQTQGELNQPPTFKLPGYTRWLSSRLLPYKTVWDHSRNRKSAHSGHPETPARGCVIRKDEQPSSSSHTGMTKSKGFAAVLHYTRGLLIEYRLQLRRGWSREASIFAIILFLRCMLDEAYKQRASSVLDI